MKKILLSAVIIALCVIPSIVAQNRFEGHNIILDAPTTQRSTACAIRFAPPATAVTVTDLDRGTPLRISGCEGSGSRVESSSGGTATLRANPSDFRWCFQGEDKQYRITFPGDQYSGPVTYNWIAEQSPNLAGLYNVRDFGAVGDGQTDDTIAIRSAFAFIASKNGGTVTFPEGDYKVTSPIAIPSGVIIQGTGSIMTGAPTSSLPRKNPTRIKLVGSNRALFRIGECSTQMTIRDIELYSESNDRTYGIEGVGAYNSSGGIFIDRVVFNNFWRGLYFYGLPQTNLEWQIDYVKVKNSVFQFNADAGIYTNSRNTDWKIEGCLFINAQRRPNQNGDSMRFERAGAIYIEDTFGGGFATAKGGTFLDILDNSLVTVIGSSTEQTTNSIVMNSEKHPLAGNLGGPVNLINNAFGDPIIFNARRTVVSTGNGYAGDTWRVNAHDVRIYSNGDRFCADGHIIGCMGLQKNPKVFDKANVVFMTGQPSEGQVTGHPTYFGTDVEFGAPVKLPTLAVNALPAGKDNGSMVYCSNCRRSTTPCQGGGSGAPAMMVAGQWSCL
jgi:hypothetical protein